MEGASFVASGHRLRPDVVVLGYFVNDAEPTPRRRESPCSSAPTPRWCSRAVSTASRRALGWRPDWRQYYDGLYDTSSPGWKQAAASMAALAPSAGSAASACWSPVSRAARAAALPFHAGDRDGRRRGRSASACPSSISGGGVRSLRPAESLGVPSDAHPNSRATKLYAARLESALTERFPELFPAAGAPENRSADR